MAVSLLTYAMHERCVFRGGKQVRRALIVERNLRGKLKRVVAKLPAIVGSDAAADRAYERQLLEARRMLAALRGRA